MKKAITTGIMVLFFVLAVTIVPLTAKAEMQAMTENEMEMVTAQWTGAQLMSGLITGVQSSLNYLGVSDAQFTTFLTTIGTSKLFTFVINRPLVKAITPTIEKLLNTEIPCTPKM